MQIKRETKHFLQMLAPQLFQPGQPDSGKHQHERHVLKSPHNRWRQVESLKINSEKICLQGFSTWIFCRFTQKSKNAAGKEMEKKSLINIVDLAGRWDRARYLIQSRTTPLFNEGSKKCWCWSYFGSLGKEVTAYSAFPRFRLFNSIKITRLYVL